MAIRVCVSKGVGVDSRCSEVDSSWLKEEYIAFDLNDKRWIQNSGQLNSQRNILYSRHVILHGCSWRIALGSIESQSWGVTYCLEGNEELSYLDRRN